MSLLTTQGIRVLQVLVAATIVLTLFFTLSSFGSESIHHGTKSVTDRFRGSESSNMQSSLPFSSSKVPKPTAANATLDFQEIIYLSMPYRTDRQDAMSLIAAVAGIKLTMLPGVTADSIHPKAMPPHVGNNDMNGTAALGIWRAHANVWKYIIDNDITSALILEDDVDFDVNIREIMGNLNWQLRYNNTIRWGRDNVQKGWDEKCSYGCDWDELFVGQCGGKPNKKRLDLHQIVPDPHTPELSVHKPWIHKEFKNQWNLTETENIRVISPTYQPLCLQAYGVSRMGAMRMLYQIGGWRPFGYPVDNEIAWRTAEGVLSGYTMAPPAFETWRVGGAQDSDNDAIMNAKEVQVKGNEAGNSFGLKNSVRKHLKEFFAKNYWKDMENERR